MSLESILFCFITFLKLTKHLRDCSSRDTSKTERRFVGFGFGFGFGFSFNYKVEMTEIIGLTQCENLAQTGSNKDFGFFMFLLVCFKSLT